MATRKIVLALLAGLLVTTNGRDFLGAKRKVNTAAIQEELKGVMAEVLGQGHGVADIRFKKIRGLVNPLFQSLPKNTRGRLSSSVMRYAVRRYFSQGHGWIVKGFEPHAEIVSANGTNTDLLQSKLPAFIRSTMEKQFAHEGFSLEALVVMIATLERLAFDEVVRGVEASFYLNEYELTRDLNIQDLNEILSSFLIIEMLEGSDNKDQHRSDKKYILERYPFWSTTILFLGDVVSNDIWVRSPTANPFVKKTYSFEDAVRMAEGISEQFGSWSNYECHEMKDMLAEMDPHETGRVKVSDFYQYSKDGAWQFLEPSEQLRLAGALDESSTWLGPQVMIANYLTSMSNCITSAPYYSICCLNECDQVFQHVERRIGAPFATSSEIILAMQSFPGFDAPELAAIHSERLHQMTSVNGGRIPLHGRLFSQWLHFVFPRECPYPHLPGKVTPMTQPQWRDMVGVDEESVTEVEMEQHVTSEFSTRDPSPDAGALMWDLDESLLEAATPSDARASSWTTLFALLRSIAHIGMLAGFVVFLNSLLQMLRAVKKQKAAEYDV